MNKQIALNLKTRADEIAGWYSNPNRDKNFNNETFEIDRITILSENTATVRYKKSSGKYVLFFFYYVNVNDGKWFYFVPTDSHILGMESFKSEYTQIENLNFPINK